MFSDSLLGTNTVSKKPRWEAARKPLSLLALAALGCTRPFTGKEEPGGRGSTGCLVQALAVATCSVPLRSFSIKQVMVVPATKGCSENLWS